jgi:RNA polymerase sigma factor (sigma-70 family)
LSKEQSFLDQINQHRGILYKIARIYVDDPDDREDLVQEMTYQVWRSYDSFKSQSLFSTYLYRICLNTAILSFKKEKRRSSTEQSFFLESENVLKDEENKKELQLSQIYNAFKYLTDIEKAILFQYLEGLPQSDISKNLGLSEVNVRVRFHRIKEKIKSIIAKTEEYENG